MKLIDGDNLIEHAEVNCESADFVEKLIDYVSEQEEISISQDHEDDLISRRKAIEALGAEPWACPETKYRLGMRAQWRSDVEALKNMPSAQSELTENWWKTDHGYMWLCPHCGLPVHSDFEECLRCGIKRPSAQPELDEWCDDCSEYDHERHCCPRWSRVIKTTLEEAQPIINVTLDEDKVARVVEHRKQMQERKKGKWIEIMDADEFGNPYPCGVRCSECGFCSVNLDNYCPNCGARMED